MSQIESFQEMISRVAKEYPNVKVFATTLRQVVSANEHLWGAIMLAEGQWYVEKPREIPVLDRIGGGDGFVGGLLWYQAGVGAGTVVEIRLGDRSDGGDAAGRLCVSGQRGTSVEYL